MSIKETMTKFAAVASDPKAQMKKYLDAGKKVVLVAPYYAPEEIVDSMGAVPMGVWGADTELNEAKRYFPAFLCSIAQSIVELGMKGEYEGASALIVPSLCDTLKVLGQNFKVAVPSIPFIPMNYPQNRKPEFGAKYCMAGYMKLAEQLELALNTSFRDEKLKESIKTYNEHNALMRKAAELMSSRGVSAKDRSDVFKSAQFMTKAEHSELLKELIEELEAQQPKQAKLPVYITGIIADNPQLNGIIDGCGYTIAGDDIAAQSRGYRVDAPEAATASASLVAKYQAQDNDSILFDPAKKHVDFVVSQAKACGAKGIIFVLTKFCDPEEFDYPMIKKACEAAGMPLVKIETDRQMVNYEQARTALETFAEIL